MYVASEIKSHTCRVVGMSSDIVAEYMTINKKGI